MGFCGVQKISLSGMIWVMERMGQGRELVNDVPVENVERARRRRNGFVLRVMQKLEQKVLGFATRIIPVARSTRKMILKIPNQNKELSAMRAMMVSSTLSSLSSNKVVTTRSSRQGRPV